MDIQAALTTFAVRSRLAAGVSTALAACSPTSLRIVNYHSVPAASAETFRQHLRWYEARFDFASPADLHRLIYAPDRWPHRRSAVLLTFDDGLHSHSSVVAPILDRFGITGCFFVPTGLIGLGRESSQALIEASLQGALRTEGERPMMDWDEVAELSRRHMVGSHTVSHIRLHGGLEQDRIDEEVLGSADELERRLGDRPNSFCWVGGEEQSYSATALRTISAGGYTYSFMTNSQRVRPGNDPLWLQRSNVEVQHPLSRIEVVMSGLNDIRYVAKRRRISRALAA